MQEAEFSLQVDSHVISGQEEAKHAPTHTFPISRQEFYRQEYRSVKVQWQDSLSIYREVIDQCTQEHTRILDIGCGHGDYLRSVYAKTQHTYGIDPDEHALSQNTIIRNKTVGTADEIPFADNFFDVIVSAWVLEHLDHPEVSLREVYRVLKPEGKVIFLTPNAWNYNVWIIRLIPNSFHSFLTRRLYDRQEHDTYPVRYKINSPRKIDRTLLPIGFKKSQVIYNGDPSYVSFNKPLFKLACFLENLLDTRWLHCAKVHVIGIYQK